MLARAKQRLALPPALQCERPCLLAPQEWKQLAKHSPSLICPQQPGRSWRGWFHHQAPQQALIVSWSLSFR
jgi:hypothetical protein